MRALLAAVCFASALAAAQPDTTVDAALRFRRLARHYEQLEETLRTLGQSLSEWEENHPAAPMDLRMRQLREELSSRLTLAHRRADWPETARLLPLLHLVDLEIAEAAIQQEENARDPVLHQMLASLRRLEARTTQRKRLAAAAADVLEKRK